MAEHGQSYAEWDQPDRGAVGGRDDIKDELRDEIDAERDGGEGRDEVRVLVERLISLHATQPRGP